MPLNITLFPKPHPELPPQPSPVTKFHFDSSILFPSNSSMKSRFPLGGPDRTRVEQKASNTQESKNFIFFISFNF